MKNDTDRITYKMKNNKNNSKKDEDSNSSRESIEMEIKSFTKNKKFSRRKTQEGEQIKFFFNDLPPEPPEKKNTKYSSFISSCKTNPPALLNYSKTKNESNFKDILLSYVNSPKRPANKNEKENAQIERRKSIIYGDPETVLTLNGDENEEKSNGGSNSRSSSKSNSHTESDSQSKSKSNSDDSDNENSVSKSKRKKNKNKKKKKKKKISQKLHIKMPKKNDNDSKEEDSNYKCKTSRHEERVNKLCNDFDNGIQKEIKNKKEKNNKKEEKKKKEIFNKKESKDKIKKKVKEKKKLDNNNHKYEYNKIINDEIKRIESKKTINTERKVKKSSDSSCINSNSFKNSQKIRNSNNNTFTTTTNTQHTQKTQNTNNSSLQSINNNKKYKYNYLCSKDLSLLQKTIIKNRSNSMKKIDIKEDNIEKLVNKDNNDIMIYKLKNLKLSLNVEKTYIHYFKNLSNLLKQKKASSQVNIFSKNNNKNKELKENNEEDSVYYPYYIDKNNTLHNKYHVSNLFAKIRKYNNYV